MSETEKHPNPDIHPNIPTSLYLQVCNEDSADPEEVLETVEMSWCATRIYDSDVRYVREDFTKGHQHVALKSEDGIGTALKLDLCNEFETWPTSDGWMVRTPFAYQDNDQVVVFIDRRPDGKWLVHDNGDAALRLMFDGVDTDSPQIQARMQELAPAVYWNKEDISLECMTSEKQLSKTVWAVAQACLQLQAILPILGDVAAERERCARACEDEAQRWIGRQACTRDFQLCAARIRAGT